MGHSLYKDTVVGPKIFPFIVPIHFCSPKEDKLLTKDNMTAPKCPLFRDSTVYSCNIYTVDICTRVLRTLVFAVFICLAPWLLGNIFNF